MQLHLSRIKKGVLRAGTASCKSIPMWVCFVQPSHRHPISMEPYPRLQPGQLALYQLLTPRPPSHSLAPTPYSKTPLALSDMRGMRPLLLDSWEGDATEPFLITCDGRRCPWTRLSRHVGVSSPGHRAGEREREFLRMKICAREGAEKPVQQKAASTERAS